MFKIVVDNQDCKANEMKSQQPRDEFPCPAILKGLLAVFAENPFQHQAPKHDSQDAKTMKDSKDQKFDCCAMPHTDDDKGHEQNYDQPHALPVSGKPPVNGDVQGRENIIPDPVAEG